MFIFVSTLDIFRISSRDGMKKRLLVRIVAGEGRLSLGNLIHETAKRPDINLFGVEAPLEDFRANPLAGA